MSLLETLASYVPNLIVQRAVQNRTQFNQASSEHCSAAVLFADISGFTALTERLAVRGVAGAEDLTTLLNAYLGELIDIVNDYGGDIVKFAGDAVLALWPVTDEYDLASRTLLIADCCQVIQSRLHQYAVADDVRLSMKLAIGAGEVLTMMLGGVFGRWEFLVTGAPLSQVGIANGHANSGDIIVAGPAWELIKDHCRGELLPDNCYKLTEVDNKLAKPSIHAVKPTAAETATLRSFVPGAIRTRLDAGQSDWLAELRQVTVLFINLPDFNYDTPLAQAQETMCALQTDLYRYEGSINKISVDDKGASLVAALGLPPLAHEDDATRGVRAALAMQAELKNKGLHSSIGVTTGLAFCGSVGSKKRREYTLMGDVVNLAARLMQAAKNDILCDEPTAKAAMSRLNFQPLAPLKVKGKEKPVEVYRPSLPPEGTIRRKAVKSHVEMVGRMAERKLLSDSLAALAQDSISGCVIIEGEPGMGKSRLIEDLLAQAEMRDMQVLLGLGDSIESTTPYYAWRSVFNTIFDLDGVVIGEDDDAGTVKRTHVLRQLPKDEKVLQLAPLMQMVLPFDWPDNEFTSQMIGKARADNTQELLIRVLQDHIKARPTLLIMEDAHWLDSASFALLVLVQQRIKPLMLVIASRPISEPVPLEYKQLIVAAGEKKISLENMLPEETVILACRRLGVDSLPEAVATLIRERAEGNPFFSEELAYAIRDAKLLNIENCHCTIASDADDVQNWKFPNTIQGVITGRIDRLTPSQQLTMKVASVIGRIFSYSTLHDIYPIDDERPNIATHFDILQHLDLTPLERPAPDLAYIFKHIITRDVAYNLMLFAQRRQLHRSIAEWYEKTYEQDLPSFYAYLAFHWHKAAEDRVIDCEMANKAIDYYQKAGDRAVHHYVNQEAITFYSEAIKLLRALPASEERNRRELQLLLALGGPLIGTRGYAASEVEDTYLRAKELSQEIGDNKLLFPALRGLWAFHIGRAEYQEARKLAEQMLQLAEAEQELAIHMEAYRALGNTVFWMGELGGARDRMEDGIKLYMPDDHRTLAFLYGQDPDVANRGMQSWPLSLMGYPEQAVKRAQESRAHAQQLAHPYSLGYAFVHETCCYQYLRDPKRTLAVALEAISLGSEKSFPNWLLAGMVLQGWALGQMGEANQGAAQIKQVVDLWRSTGSELVVPYFMALLAEIQIELGEYQNALANLNEAFQLAERNSDLWYVPEMYRLKGNLLFLTGDEAGAAQNYQKAIESARKQQAKLFELRTTVSLAKMLRQQGQVAEARNPLAEVYNWFTEGFEFCDLQDAKALLDELAIN